MIVLGQLCRLVEVLGHLSRLIVLQAVQQIMLL